MTHNTVFWLWTKHESDFVIFSSSPLYWRGAPEAAVQVLPQCLLSTAVHKAFNPDAGGGVAGWTGQAASIHSFSVFELATR